MAVISPAGSATSMAIAEASSVPITSGSTPKCLSEKSGVHTVPKRNSPIGTSPRKATVSNSSTEMIPAVIGIEPAALRKSARSIASSIRCRMRRRVIGIGRLPRQQLFERDLAVAVDALEHRPGLPRREPAPDRRVSGR